MDTAEYIVNDIQNVPMLSEGVSRLIETLSDPDHTVSDIARIVETDAVLAAELLRVVNSAAFSLSGKINAISRALPYLGDKMVMQIALSKYASFVFDSPLKGYHGQQGDLWAHSLGTAIAARQIAHFAVEECNADVAYTGGLLHDIGKPILSKYLENSAVSSIVHENDDELSDYLGIERSELGIGHSEVGAILAKKWNLSDELQEIIHYHHEPRLPEIVNRTLVYVVHLGDMISMMAGIGTGEDCLKYKLERDYTQYVRLSKDELAGLMLDVQLEFSNVKASLRNDKKEKSL